MPEISSASFSETDASNNSAAPDGFPENMPPSGVNDAARAVMGALKRFWNRINPATNTTGSANAYVLTPTGALAAYVDGEVYSFQANFANTGAATLNISALGAKSIKKFVAGAKAALAADDIGSGQPVQCCYDGTDMVMLGAAGIGVATQAEQETGTSVAVFVTPGRQHLHPSAAKCWGIVTESGGVYTLQTSFNITSITKNTTGDVTVTIATDFSGVNYAVLVSGTGGGVAASYNITNAGAFRVRIYNFVTAADANAGFSFACFGDQA